jgi:hypothetical protein
MELLIKNDLAILGGPKTIETPFKKYSPIGREEADAVSEVMRSGILSQYIGRWSDDFFGGPKVQQFETDAANYFGVKHAITVNSWTSGLVAALGAIDLQPGDEVIVPRLAVGDDIRAHSGPPSARGGDRQAVPVGAMARAEILPSPISFKAMSMKPMPGGTSTRGRLEAVS